MPAPVGRYTSDIGLIEVEITADLVAAVASLVTGDIGWIDISDYVKMVSPGSPGARSSTQEYNASMRTAMTSRSQIVPNHTPELQVYDQNGAVATFTGVTADLDLRQHIFMPALTDDIELPLRFSKIGTTGKPLFTYGACYVMQIQQGGISPGETGSDVYTVNFDAETVTESVLA